MPLSVFPAVVTSSSSSPSAKSINCATANTLYSGISEFVPGTYTLTCINSSVVSYTFLNQNTLITSGSTTSGTVTINLATPATRVLVSSNTGTNVIATITLIAGIIAPVSGTVETLTNSQTYNQSGFAYVVAVGGGQGGYAGGGNGGTGGSVVGGYTTLDGSGVSVVIGSGGNGGAANPNVSGANASPGSGGATSFGNNINAAGGGSGGSPGTSPYLFVVSGSNGNGASPNSAATGSGIGSGGNYSGSYNGNGGSGYGSGGGYGNQRGGNITSYGGPGTQGVVYVLRP